MEREEETQRRGGGGNWIGILIFLLVIGSQFVPGLMRGLGSIFGPATTQQLGTSISSLLPFVITGLIVLSILWAIGSTIARAAGGTTDVTATSTVNLPKPLPTSGYTNINANQINNTPQISSSSLPAGVKLERERRFHLGQSTWESANMTITSARQLPRHVRMEIPPGLDMEKISKYGTRNQYRTPGFEPMIDGNILTFGLVIVGALVFGGLGLMWLAGMLP